MPAPRLTRPPGLLLAALLLSAACGGGGDGPAAPPAPPPVRAAGVSDAWWHGAVVYEVFVRSFQDSDGDGIGDLAGLTARLDYLNDGDPATTADLGVDALWLMPVFASPSSHGYDVTDYEAIEPDYGTGADFDALIAAAHARGIRIILDLVINHTGSGHPWFLEAQDPASPRRDWYVWSVADLGWKQPWDQFTGAPTWHQAAGGAGWYYGAFFGGMPDLNWRTPAVAAELDRIAAAWLARGVDGFRLDAVRYLVEDGGGAQQDRPATHAALKAFAGGVLAADPGALVVGEIFDSSPTLVASYHGDPAVPGGDELPLTFDFPLRAALVGGVGAGRAQPIAAALDAATRAYPAGACDAPFLDNHDLVRTTFGNDRGLQKVAAGILLTLPCTPFLYYGQELGLPNACGGGDECKRAPMPWDATAGGGFTGGTPWFPLAAAPAGTTVAAQAADPGSTLSAYRALLRARAASPALRRGDLRLLQDPGADVSTLAYARTGGGETVLVVHNLSGGFGSVGPLEIAGSAAAPLLVPPGATLSQGAGGWRASLPGRSTALWRVTP